MLTKRHAWVAVMTRSHFEATVASLLEEAGIEAYLPMMKVRDLRNKRGGMIEKPMFPCYLFARINNSQVYQTRTTRGAVGIVTINHNIIEVPQRDIDNVHAFEASQRQVFIRETCKLIKGAWVTVTGGEFAGMTGRLLKDCNDGNFCVSLSVMNLSFVVELGRSELLPVDEPTEEEGIELI